MYDCSYDGWKNATDIQKATYQFCWWFERPSEYTDKREKNAKEYYNKFCK